MALGKGLSALLGQSDSIGDGALHMIAVDAISPNKLQPRRFFDEKTLRELASSISLHGILQPVIVCQIDPQEYMLVAGERRWRASKMAGLFEIPAIVIDLDEKKAAEIALLENIQRDNLGALEEAIAYKSLMDKYSFTQQELAQTVGKSRSHVANLLRLLDLPEDLRELLINRKITMGHARALLKYDDYSHIIDDIMHGKASVRATEKMISKRKKGDEQISSMMSDISGFDVSVECDDNGSGKVVIQFSSFAELDKIMEDFNRILKKQ